MHTLNAVSVASPDIIARFVDIRVETDEFCNVYAALRKYFPTDLVVWHKGDVIPPHTGFDSPSIGW